MRFTLFSVLSLLSDSMVQTKDQSHRVELTQGTRPLHNKCFFCGICHNLERFDITGLGASLDSRLSIQSSRVQLPPRDVYIMIYKWLLLFLALPSEQPAAQDRSSRLQKDLTLLSPQE
jgi:hypothetical protein